MVHSRLIHGPCHDVIQVKEYVLDVSLSALLQCRVREGFKDGRIVDTPEAGISIS